MSDQASRKATLTTPSDREIHVERVFEAPRERVFAARVDPELIPQWWGQPNRRPGRSPLAASRPGASGGDDRDGIPRDRALNETFARRDRLGG